MATLDPADVKSGAVVPRQGDVVGLYSYVNGDPLNNASYQPLSGEDYLNALPPSAAPLIPMIKGYAAGTLPTPAATDMRNPQLLQLLQMARQYDPSFTVAGRAAAPATNAPSAQDVQQALNSLPNLSGSNRQNADNLALPSPTPRLQIGVSNLPKLQAPPSGWTLPNSQVSDNTGRGGIIGQTSGDAVTGGILGQGPALSFGGLLGDAIGQNDSYASDGGGGLFGGDWLASNQPARAQIFKGLPTPDNGVHFSPSNLAPKDQAVLGQLNAMNQSDEFGLGNRAIEMGHFASGELDPSNVVVDYGPTNSVQPTAQTQAAVGTNNYTYDDLIAAQDAARNDPHFQPSARTHCNEALVSIVHRLNAPDDDFTDNNGEPLLANQMARNLATSDQYTAVDPDQAQRLADRGILVVAAWDNPGGHGHVATVRPENVPGDNPRGRRGALISNVGKQVGIQSESSVFPSGAQVHYYTPVTGH
jgi:hypothetical protein